MYLEQLIQRYLTCPPEKDLVSSLAQTCLVVKVWGALNEAARKRQWQ